MSNDHILPGDRRISDFFLILSFLIFHLFHLFFHHFYSLRWCYSWSLRYFLSKLLFGALVTHTKLPPRYIHTNYDTSNSEFFLKLYLILSHSILSMKISCGWKCTVKRSLKLRFHIFLTRENDGFIILLSSETQCDIYSLTGVYENVISSETFRCCIYTCSG